MYQDRTCHPRTLPLEFRIYRLSKREGRNTLEYLQRMNSTSIGSRDPRRSRKTRKTKRRGQRTGRKQRERYIARKHDCRSSYPNKSSLFKTEFCYSESIISIGEARLSLQLDEVARLSPLPCGNGEKKIFSRTICRLLGIHRQQSIFESRYSHSIVLEGTSCVEKQRYLREVVTFI